MGCSALKNTFKSEKMDTKLYPKKFAKAMKKNIKKYLLDAPKPAKNIYTKEGNIKWWKVNMTNLDKIS